MVAYVKGRVGVGRGVWYLCSIRFHTTRSLELKNAVPTDDSMRMHKASFCSCCQPVGSLSDAVPSHPSKVSRAGFALWRPSHSECPGSMSDVSGGGKRGGRRMVPERGQWGGGILGWRTLS